MDRAGRREAPRTTSEIGRTTTARPRRTPDLGTLARALDDRARSGRALARDQTPPVCLLPARIRVRASIFSIHDQRRATHRADTLGKERRQLLGKLLLGRKTVDEGSQLRVGEHAYHRDGSSGKQRLSASPSTSFGEFGRDETGSRTDRRPLTRVPSVSAERRWDARAFVAHHHPADERGPDVATAHFERALGKGGRWGCPSRDVLRGLVAGPSSGGGQNVAGQVNVTR